MPGKRQPTDVIKANGRKHLSRAEEAQRRAGEVNLSTAKTARPPSWLPEELKKSFRALGRQLIEAKLFTELDRDTLGRYVVAQHQWELASKAAGEALEQGDQEKADGWSRIQDRYFKQARACANDMGLTGAGSGGAGGAGEPVPPADPGRGEPPCLRCCVWPPG